MSRRAREVLPALAVVVLFALPLLPEILGSRVLVFRDAQITHWPWHRVAVSALASGELPFINAAASGGQPLLANPNAVLLYPTFLLEKILLPAAAFNLHYLIHVVWAFWGARRLARTLAIGKPGALLAGVAFAFSGVMLSYGSAFMNSIAAAAWMPWCAAAFLGLARARTARDALSLATAGGLALGLQLLAGEPAISLLTIAFAGAVGLCAALRTPLAGRAASAARFLWGSAAAGALGLALAAPLLLPLWEIFPLTYRGQHLYSEQAFGAAAFSLARTIEWLLPRFGGDPGLLGGGANWLTAVGKQNVVYIWCVSFGVVPLLVLLAVLPRKDFWNRRSALLATGAFVSLLLSFGFSLPFYRLFYAITFLRKLRYPIKFYLVTTLCVALLSGMAAERLERRRAGRWAGAALAVLLILFGAAWALAAPGGWLERWAAPLAKQVSEDPSAFLAVFRRLVRADASLGVVAALLVALAVSPAKRLREPGYALAFLTLAFSFSWGLPLFVSAPRADLLRPPAMADHLREPGRLYLSPTLPRFNPSAIAPEEPGELARSARVSRILVEQLVPATGEPFGVRYLFDNDPDGSYGFYNRLASEAADASTASERDRLLILYGARWVLAREGEAHPHLRPATGLEIAGERIVLFENDHPVPELRWAGRVWRRRALSATLELVRSERFDPYRDIALPGRRDEEVPGPFAAGRLDALVVGADHAAATIEAEGPGHLIFSRTFFPAWHARVDGIRAPTLVANARELAVPVPAGRHRVEFEYDRKPFRRGVAVQAAALVIALLAAFAKKPLATRRAA